MKQPSPELYPWFIGVILIGILLASVSIARADEISGIEPDQSRASELVYTLRQDCGSCHGLTLKGGLGPALLPADLADKDEEGLVDTILFGRPGTPMPPWNNQLTEKEAKWLVRLLKEGLKDE